MESSILEIKEHRQSCNHSRCLGHQGSTLLCIPCVGAMAYQLAIGHPHPRRAPGILCECCISNRTMIQIFWPEQTLRTVTIHTYHPPKRRAGFSIRAILPLHCSLLLLLLHCSKTMPAVMYCHCFLNVGAARINSCLASSGGGKVGEGMLARLFGKSDTWSLPRPSFMPRSAQFPINAPSDTLEASDNTTMTWR